jgi:hypothetical protein
MTALIGSLRSRESRVGLATATELYGRGSIPGSGNIFYTPQRQNFLWGPLYDEYWGDLYEGGGVKRPRRQADHIPPSNAVVKNGDIPPRPYLFIEWYQIN